jgi:hypothetical protein
MIWAASQLRAVCLASGLLVSLAPAACTTHVLNANLTFDELSKRVAANFHQGMAYEDVNAKLTQLGVSEGTRRTYSPTPPREMLTRLYPPGGAWVNEPDQSIEWWELTLSFDAQDRLAAARAFNGGARYIHGWADYVNPPPPPGVRVRYPQTIPPPSQPPEGTAIPLGQ